MYDFFKLLLFRPVVKFLFGAKLAGEENIPATGGAVLAVNHIGAFETYALPALMRRRLTFPAKAELFAGNRGLASKVVAWFLKGVGQVPLDRSGGRTSLDGLRPVLQVLEDGGLVGIFPEGTRSPDGRLYRGKTGVARIALTADVPVIPIAAFSTQTVRNRLGIPWVRKPRLVAGEPLHFPEYAGRGDDREVIRWVTDEVMAGIQKLSGQTYVEAYASSVKYGSLTAEEAKAKELPRPGYGSTPPALPAAEE